MDKYRLKHKKVFNVKKKKPIYRSKIFWLLILCLAFFGSAFYFLLFSPYFQIKVINVSGNISVKSADIMPIIENNTKKKIVFFETKNIFLANLKEAKLQILERFPKIEKVAIARNFTGQITAEIKERAAFGEVCGEVCFNFDKEGIAFEQAQDNGTGEIKVNFEVRDYKITLGKQEILPENVAAIAGISGILTDNFNILPKVFILSMDQKKLAAKTSEGWIAYFALDQNINSAISNLDILLKEKISIKDRANLDYIDLRYGNRIFYKKK